MVKKILDKCAEALAAVSAFCFATIFAVNVVNIICRTFFGFSILWTTDFSLLMAAWTMLLAMAVLIYRSDHITVTFLVDKMPLKVRQVLRIVTRLTLLATCIMLFFEGIVVTQLRMGILFVMLRWPTAYAFAALPVFALMSSVFLSYNTYIAVKKLIKPNSNDI